MCCPPNSFSRCLVNHSPETAPKEENFLVFLFVRVCSVVPSLHIPALSSLCVKKRMSMSSVEEDKQFTLVLCFTCSLQAFFFQCWLQVSADLAHYSHTYLSSNKMQMTQLIPQHNHLTFFIVFSLTLQKAKYLKGRNCFLMSWLLLF